MPECESIQRCIFFTTIMEEMPGMSAIYKTRYCRGDYKSCARWIVKTSAGKDAVPADLYPNQAERVEGLIAKAKQAG